MTDKQHKELLDEIESLRINTGWGIAIIAFQNVVIVILLLIL